LQRNPTAVKIEGKNQAIEDSYQKAVIEERDMYGKEREIMMEEIGKLRKSRNDQLAELEMLRHRYEVKEHELAEGREKHVKME